jgi:nicotinamidase-related amidase
MMRLLRQLKRRAVKTHHFSPVDRSCLTFPALMALDEGFEVYVVTDTSGGTSVDAHERAIDRMVQAGAVPVTWQQVCC